MYYVELFYPEINYYYTMSPTKNDFIEYLWEQQLNVKFNPCLYKYDDENGFLYKELEMRWLNNDIDEPDLIRSDGFKNYLAIKYKKEAYNNHGKSVGLVIGKHNLNDADSYQETLNEPLF